MTTAAPRKQPMSPSTSLAQRVLVCDDEKNMRNLLVDVLEDDGWTVSAAQDGREALEELRNADPPYPVAVVDLSMPGLDGFQVIEEARRGEIPTAIIVITAYGTIDAAVKAMRSGASDFIVKPFDNARIRSAVRKSLETRDLVRRAELSHPILLSDGVDKVFLGPDSKPLPIIGSDSRMAGIFEIVSRVASTRASVLITGESGTGKELVAQAIHYNGDRRMGPFVAVNCGALPENLLESEFFGHEKGAFTDARATQRGKFELAHGGTLFLDEIGEMPLNLQVKLLRVLAEGRFRRVGGEKEMQTDVRIIAATNRDLREAVEQRHFREDLYYRLNVIPIHLPPLRERQGDIPSLVDFFNKRFSERHRLPPLPVSGDLRQRIMARPWPGNIRELQNAVEKSVVFQNPELLASDDGGTGVPAEGAAMAPSASIGEHQMLLDLGNGEQAIRPLGDVAADAQRGALIRALRLSGGNKAEAAKRLGVSYKTLFNKIHELNISISTTVK